MRGDCLLSVYAQNVMATLKPYLSSIAIQGIELGHCITKISCVVDGGSTIKYYSLSVKSRVGATLVSRVSCFACRDC